MGLSNHTNDQMCPILSKLLLNIFYLVKLSYLCGVSGSEEKTFSLFCLFLLCTVLAVLLVWDPAPRSWVSSLLGTGRCLSTHLHQPGVGAAGRVPKC